MSLWEHLVPELTGTNKETLFLTVLCVCGSGNTFLGLGARVHPPEAVGRDGEAAERERETGPAGQYRH